MIEFLGWLASLIGFERLWRFGSEDGGSWFDYGRLVLGQRLYYCDDYGSNFWVGFCCELLGLFDCCNLLGLWFLVLCFWVLTVEAGEFLCFCVWLMWRLVMEGIFWQWRYGLQWRRVGCLVCLCVEWQWFDIGFVGR